MNYRITGLDFSQFSHLAGLADDELQQYRATRVIADSSPGYPDRIELRDAKLNESLILVNYTHQPAESPFRSSHAVYVLEHAGDRFDRINQVPEVLHNRTISLRAFDGRGMIVEAALAEGKDVEPAIESLFENPAAEYLHLHYAKLGCYACRVDRAS